MTDAQKKLTVMVEDFCDEYLNEEYKQLSLTVIEEMANSKSVYFKRGKLEVWASAVIYAVCQINSLFDEANENHISRNDILNYFNTKQSIVSKKAVNLRNIYNLDNKLSLNSENESFSDLEDEIYRNIMENDFDNLYPMFDNEDMSIEDYEKAIQTFEKEFGEEFFKENEYKFY